MTIKTKPIDFAGCHPVIAEQLKQSKSILCWVWDSESEKDQGWVFSFSIESDYHYRVANLNKTRNIGFEHAEPIEFKTETRVKKASQCFAWFEENKILPDKDGTYFDVRRNFVFIPSMLIECGRVPSGRWGWISELLEEVEIES